jgi:hypothetical protein
VGRLPPIILDSRNPLEFFGLGAHWTAYPADQATELGVVLLALGLVFMYLGVRTKGRTYRVHPKISGLAGLLVFVTWTFSAVVVFFSSISSARAGFLYRAP